MSSWRVMDRYPGLETTRVIHEAVRELIGEMIGDLLEETRRRLAEAKPASAADIRAMDRPLVGFTDAMNEHNAALKAFLFERMYRHYRVNRSMSKAQRIVRDLFGLLHRSPEQLPPEWQQGCDGPEGFKTARRVCDFIAGMTDKFAIEGISASSISTIRGPDHPQGKGWKRGRCAARVRARRVHKWRQE